VSGKPGIHRRAMQTGDHSCGLEGPRGELAVDGQLLNESPLVRREGKDVRPQQFDASSTSDRIALGAVSTDCICEHCQDAGDKDCHSERDLEASLHAHQPRRTFRTILVRQQSGIASAQGEDRERRVAQLSRLFN